MKIRLNNQNMKYRKRMMNQKKDQKQLVNLFKGMNNFNNN